MKSNKIKCHFISNTHWDREWRFSAQRTRHMLGYLLDTLFDIFEKDKEYKHFHLDSQTMPIQDYLEVFPDKSEIVKKHVSEGRLAIGPWYCLPDEFCVSGELLIRNLLLGHKMGKKFGGVSKTGYSPFGWGQISQMPQIYKGFGIDMISFYRGLNHYLAPKSEFIWESPDGTQILASRLGARPRYNVWYIIQRPVYFNQSDENNRVMSWKGGSAPFRFIDSDKYENDYLYAHPQYRYHKDNIPKRAEQAIKEQDNDWTTPHRFWSDGHDSSCPDIREVDMIRDCNEALGNSAEVFHSTVKNLQDGIISSVNLDELKVLKGEMHHPYTKGSVSELFGWILSARTHIKQDNFKTERDISSYAEPLAVFASFQGAPHPQEFIDLSYNYLLQNQGHDSIGACGRDIVYEDVIYRSRQSREISSCILERAMADIAGDINLSTWFSSEMAIVVYNPTPYRRNEVIEAIIEIPHEWEAQSIEILDEEKNKIKVQICEKIQNRYSVVQSPNDTANTFPSSRYLVRGEFKNIPSMGYSTYKVVPLKTNRNIQPKSMRLGVQKMENKYLTVEINSNGTLNIFDKINKKFYENMGYFRDTGEVGNPWVHIIPDNNVIYTTLNQNAEITLINDGELEVSFSIKINWLLPEGRTADNSSRSKNLKDYKITNIVTLRKDQRWIEIITELDNCVEDHYLQVSFPTGLKAKNIMAQGQFDIIKRPIKRPDYTLYDEIPMTEHPMNSFIDLNEGENGIGFLNEGLKSYEAHDDIGGTVSLTLLRCYPLKICVTTEMIDYSHLDKGSQCLGKHLFRYAIMPHTGDCFEGEVWKASEFFNLKLSAAQIGPTKYGKNPLSKSFLELKDEGLHISGIKQSEKGDTWIIRIFNPLETDIVNSIRLNDGYVYLKSQSPVERIQGEFELPKDNKLKWKKIRLLNLDETFFKDIQIDDDGWVDFMISKKKILTMEFGV